MLLMLTVVFSTLTFAIPSYAENREEAFIKYIFYNDFSDISDTKDYYSGSAYNNVSSIYNEAEGTLSAGYEYTGEGTLKLSSAAYGGVSINAKKSDGSIPKLIVSYNINPKFTFNGDYYYASVMDQRGISSIALFNNTNTAKTGGRGIYVGMASDRGWKAENKLLDVESFDGETWYNITLIYDNDNDNSLVNNRDIYINGEYKGTYTALNSTDFNYARTGKFEVRSYFNPHGGDSIEFDDFKAYEYPAELNYEITSAADKEIALTFNMIPNKDTVITDNFSLSSAENTLTVSEASISSKDPRQVILTLEEKLQPGTEYSVTASNITAGKLLGAVGEQLTLTSKELGFETKPLKIYAENLKLYNGGEEVSSLTDGTYTVETSFINESQEALTPVIAAGLYDDNNQLKSLQLIPVADPTQPIDEEITLTDTEGLTLKLFMLKSKEAPEPVSAVSVYSAASKESDKAFDPEVKMLKDSFDIETTVNGDTQVITTKISQFAALMERPATILVLKKGKTASDIDTTDPMATIAALDSVNLTAEGASYKIPDIKDDYESYVYLKNSENYGHKSFTYYGIQFMEEGKTAVKNITAAEIDSFITEYKDAINLDTSEYELLKDGTGGPGEINEKAIVAKSIEAQRLEKTPAEFTNYEEFIEAYNVAVELVSMKTGADVADIINNLPEDECTELYKETISDDAVASVHSELKENIPLTMNEFNEAFKKYVILKGIEKSENHTQTQAIMENTAEITLVDMSVYNTLTDKKPVNVAITKKSYESFELLNAAFEKAAKDQKAKENALRLPSGGSSGGGGGSGGVKDTAVIPSPMDKTEIEANAKQPDNTGMPEAQEKKFTDLEGFAWAKDAIYTLYEKGIVNGVSAFEFNPGGEVKREEFVKMIATLYTAEEKEAEFTDVDKNAWYAPYINKAVSAGIIKGMDDNTFGLGKGVKRQDMAVMIARAVMPEEAASEEKFADDGKISDYAKEAVYSLKQKGIISGTGNGNFEPERIMTRAEAAVLICNILKTFNK